MGDMASHGIAIGLKGSRGFQVTKIDKKRGRAAIKRGPQFGLVSEVIREVTGFAPYEKRVAEFLKNGLDKRALRLASRRLGSFQRGKKKREAIAKIMREEEMAKKKTGTAVVDKAATKATAGGPKVKKVKKSKRPKNYKKKFIPPVTENK